MASIRLRKGRWQARFTRRGYAPETKSFGTREAAMGLAGMSYSAIVARRMRKWDVYRPAPEDRLFHAALPVTAYTLLGAGMAVLVLLFVGIRNAWDATAYHVFVNMRKARY